MPLCYFGFTKLRDLSEGRLRVFLLNLCQCNNFQDLFEISQCNSVTLGMEESPVFLWSVGRTEDKYVIVSKLMIQIGGRNSSVPWVRISNPTSDQIEIKLQCAKPAGISEGWDIPSAYILSVAEEWVEQSG